MTTVRFTLLPLALLGLSACAGPTPAGPVARYAAGDAATHMLAGSLPAAAGRVVAVRRSDDANGMAEEVVLEGPSAMTGENRITVTTTSGAGSRPRDRTRDGGPPSEDGLEAEMLAAIPDARMTISADVERNAEGPFGYATGTAGRLHCLYAWQYLAPERPMSLIDGLSESRHAATSIRVRLCRDLPVETLLGVVRRLSLARREDGTAGSAATGDASAGDALDAALGPVRRMEAVRSDPAAPAHEPRRHPPLARSAPRHVVVLRRGRPGRRWRGHAAPRSRPPVIGSSGATRVPMPDQVAVEPDGARPDPVRTTDRVAAARDPLPLPH